MMQGLVRNGRAWLALSMCGFVFSGNAVAQLQAPGNAPLSMPVPNHNPNQPLPEAHGVVSWKLLGQVKSVQQKNRIVPQFTKEIQALHQQEVKVQGFMMPMQAGEKQTHFLLTITSQTCAFCLPAGPEGIIEVYSKTPVKMTFEPVLLTGRMEVLKDDPMGVYYRLQGASQLAFPTAASAK